MPNQILTAQTANGSSDEIPVCGRGTFYAYGTWDTATMTLEVSGDDGTTWVSAGSDATFTDDGQVNFEIYDGLVRATVSSVGGSTSLNAYIGS